MCGWYYCVYLVSNHTFHGTPYILFDYEKLTFYKPDMEKFRNLKLAIEVCEKEKTYPAVLNAANEVAVERFLNHEIRFDQITQISQEILNNHQFDAHPSLEHLQAADRWAREEALRWNS